MGISVTNMGKAGHALEVFVEGLFLLAGFEANTNRRTKVGEVDVVVRWQGFDAYIECKEYNNRSTATVTRDMISNIAQKATLEGTRNAVLVTTKAPSDGLLEFARQAGVIVRSYDDVQAIRKRVLEHQDTETRRQLVLKEFNLVDNPDDLTSRRRREFLKGVMAGNVSGKELRAGLIEGAAANKNRLLLYGLPAVLAIVLAAVLVPAFRNGLLSVAIVAGFLVYMVNQKFGKTPRRARRKTRKS